MNNRIVTILAILLIFNLQAPAQDSAPQKSGSTPSGSAPPGLSGSAPRGGSSLGAAGAPTGGSQAGSGQSTPPGGPSGLPGMGSMPTGMGDSGGVIGGIYTKEKDVKAMTLEELLAKALKDNPDIRVAETKARDAEAELNRARQQVAQKITLLYEELKGKREIAKEAERRHQIEIELKNKGGAREISDARLSIIRAHLEVTKLESELHYLIGKQIAAMSAPVGASGAGAMMPPGGMMGSMPGMGSTSGPVGMPMGGSMGDFGSAKNLPASLADKVRAALEAPIKGEFRDSRPSEVIEWLTSPFKGINIHITAKIPDNTKVTIKLTDPIPTGAALQWLEDELGLVCILRDYGIIIAARDRVPPGATPLLDYWKKSRASESKPKQ